MHAPGRTRWVQKRGSRCHGNTVRLGLAGPLRSWLRKARGPWCRCPDCGETYQAAGYFDLTHVEDVDGVACGAQGVPVETGDSGASEGGRSKP